jgi:MFS family permease
MQVITIVSHIASARCTTFSALLGCRALNGIGFGGMMSIGTPVLNDMFFLHERGEMTGIYTIFVTNGAHIAVLGKRRMKHSSNSSLTSGL